MDSRNDKTESFMYTSCTTRSDQDAFRVCPSKLTKRELEDLYFTLLEEYIAQKKAINGQQEKIKTLTTKVQRMFSAQKVHQADGRRHCCVSNKILDLERINERMAERIRQLNAQLISARKTSKNPSLNPPKCTKSTSAANMIEDNKSYSSVLAQTDVASIPQVCDENRCRTVMDELKQKIANLEQELVKTHNEYSNRMSHLENEILQFRYQELPVRREFLPKEPEPQFKNLPVTSIGVDDELADLKKQLSEEKKKVAELENKLKIVATSSHVTERTDEKLPITQEQPPDKRTASDNFLGECTCTPVCEHSKPICTVLRIFNRGLLDSVKEETFNEIKESDNMDASKFLGRNKNNAHGSPANKYDQLTDNYGRKYLPNDKKNKELPKVENEDAQIASSSCAKNAVVTYDKKLEEYPNIEYNFSADDNDYLDKSDINCKVLLYEKELETTLNVKNYEDIPDLYKERDKEEQDNVSKRSPDDDKSRTLQDKIFISDITKKERPQVEPQLLKEVVKKHQSDKIIRSTDNTSQRTDDRRGDSKSKFSDGMSTNVDENIYDVSKLVNLNKNEAEPTIHTSEGISHTLTTNNNSNQRVSCVKKFGHNKGYHRCRCWSAKKSADAFDSNENKDPVQAVDNIRVKKPKNNVNDDLTDLDKIFNGHTQGSPDINEVKNQRNSDIEKEAQSKLGFKNRIKALPEMTEKQGLTQTDMICNKHIFDESQEQNNASQIENNNIFNKKEFISQIQHDDNKRMNVPDPTNRQGLTGAKNNLPECNDESSRDQEAMKNEYISQNQRDDNRFNLPNTTNRQGLTDANNNLAECNDESSKDQKLIENEHNLQIPRDDNKRLNLPDTTNRQGLIDANNNLPECDDECRKIHDQMENEYKSQIQRDDNKRVHLQEPTNRQGLTDLNNNLPKRNDEYSRDEKLIDLNVKKDTASVKAEISNNQDKTGQVSDDVNRGKDLVDSKIKTDNTDNNNKPGASRSSFDPYSIHSPSLLRESLTNICDDQLETIAELERQISFRKMAQLPNHKINKLGEYFNTDEDDVNSMPFNKDNKSTKLDITTTPFPVKKEVEDSSTKNAHANNVGEFKQNKETIQKIVTNGRKEVTSKDDRHNSLQIPGPIPPTAATNNWKTNATKRISHDIKKRNVKANKQKANEVSTGKETNKNEDIKTSAVTQGKTISVQEEDHNIILKTDKPNEKVIKPRLVTKYIRHNGLNNSVKQSANQASNLDPGDLICMPQTVKTAEKDVQVDPKHGLFVGDVPKPTQRELQTYRNKDGTLCFETRPVMDRSRCCQCNKQFHCEDFVTKAQTQPAGPTFTDENKYLSAKVASAPVTINEEKALPNTAATTSKSPPTSVKSTTGTIIESISINISENEKINTGHPLPITAQTPPAGPASMHENQYTGTTPTSTPATIKEERVLPTTAVTTTKCPPISDKREMGTITEKINNPLPTSALPKSRNITLPEEDISTTLPKVQTMQLMEEKLQALTQELARYKAMLLNQQMPQPTENKEDRIEQLVQGPSERRRSTSALSDLDNGERNLALKRGVAKHTIGDTYTPRCVFTLHIGTVVLSDEAVLSTRDKSLILAWKFYNQNVSITRMSAGRVMLFDFSSEYDIQITDEFLEYMKSKEMVISICELDNQSEPYATCSLPLRDALLHTNRRADMSLELLAGPKMINARNENHTEDALDTGDEVGVIDLWCMLQAEAKMLPIINNVIARSSTIPKKENIGTRVIKPIIDHDYDSDVESSSPESHPKFMQTFQDVRASDNKVIHRWGSSILRLPSKEWSDTPNVKTSTGSKNEEFNERPRLSETKTRDSNLSFKPFQRKKSQPQSKSDNKSGRSRSSNQSTQVSQSSMTPQYDPNKYPLRRVSSGVQEDLDGDQGHGGFLINEVIANIKTPDDMKHAMENTYRNSLHLVSRIPKKPDDIVSQAHSATSHNFIRSWLRRRSLEKASCKSGATTSSGKSRKKEQDYHPTLLLPEEPSDIDSVYKKYDNISKLYNSRQDVRKQVTINSNNAFDYSVEDLQKDDAVEVEDTVNETDQTVSITILWLALNEECEAMCNPSVQRVYVAYSFLGKSGAELETPFSLPKPKHHVDKCYFNFKKNFQVGEEDISLLGHMARCRAASRVDTEFKDCIVFSVISEPPEDPLGLDTCEDIGYAYLYLGDLLAYSAGSPGYTEVVPVRARGGSSVCGVLAVRLDGLDVLRRCAKLTAHQSVPTVE